MNLRTWMLPLLAWGFAAPGLVAQDAGSVATVTGTVRADGTGAPIPNAVVSIPARFMAVLTGDDGSFALDGVPAGTQVFRVEQFGYRELVVTRVVDGEMAPLDLHLLPDPLELEALEVEVDGALTISGRVLHARTREGLPDVWVWVPGAGRGVATDSSGTFRMPEVATGPQLLQIEHVGYGRRYIPVLAVPPWAPLEIELEPDDVVLAGIEAAERDLRIRRNRYRGVVTHYDAIRLRELEVDDTWKVVQSFSFAQVVACTGTRTDPLTGIPPGAWCVRSGRDVIVPVVCIDGGLRLGGLDALQEYRPHELASLEIFGTLGTTIRAYTHGYMETLARREADPPAHLQPDAGAATGLGWETRATRERSFQIPDVGIRYEGAPC